MVGFKHIISFPTWHCQYFTDPSTLTLEFFLSADVRRWLVTLIFKRYSDPTELQISELLAQRSPSATQEAWALLATVEEDGTVHVGHYNQMINVSTAY